MTPPPELFSLKWTDFQGNIAAAWRLLRTTKAFSDVTLACEDGVMVQAHKVVLASSSPFFENLLMANQHIHPLILVKGRKSEDLVAIVDFLYRGEASVQKDNMESFFSFAEEIQLKGLTKGGETKKKDKPADIETEITEHYRNKHVNLTECNKGTNNSVEETKEIESPNKVSEKIVEKVDDDGSGEEINDEESSEEIIDDEESNEEIIDEEESNEETVIDDDLDVEMVDDEETIVKNIDDPSVENASENENNKEIRINNKNVEVEGELEELVEEDIDDIVEMKDDAFLEESSGVTMEKGEEEIIKPVKNVSMANVFDSLEMLVTEDEFDSLEVLVKKDKAAEKRVEETNIEIKDTLYETMDENSFVEEKRNTEEVSKVNQKENIFEAYSASPEDLDAKIASLMTIQNLKSLPGRGYACKVCGKEMNIRRHSNMVSHVESWHIKDITQACDLCGVPSKTRAALKEHKRRKHSKAAPASPGLKVLPAPQATLSEF